MLLPLHSQLVGKTFWKDPVQMPGDLIVYSSDRSFGDTWKETIAPKVLSVYKGLHRHDCKGVEAKKKEKGKKKKWFSVLTSN